MKFLSVSGGDYNTMIRVKQVPRKLLLETFICSWSTIRRKNVRKFFDYVQGDIEVPENLRNIFDNFPLIFQNTRVSLNDIGLPMKNYVEGGRIMS